MWPGTPAVVGRQLKVSNEDEVCPGCGNRYDGDNLCMPSACQDEVPPAETHSCGYLEGSFACKIRHININAGAARSNKGMKEQWENRKTPPSS